MPVYFIQSGDYIKIGFSNNVNQRLKSIQTDNPEQLLVLLIMPGDVSLEQWLHNYFASTHYRGEWFRLNESIDEFINTHKQIFFEYQSEIAHPKVPVSTDGDKSSDVLTFIRAYYETTKDIPTYSCIVENTPLTSKGQVKPYIDIFLENED